MQHIIFYGGIQTDWFYKLCIYTASGLHAMMNNSHIFNTCNVKQKHNSYKYWLVLNKSLAAK